MFWCLETKVCPPPLLRSPFPGNPHQFSSLTLHPVLVFYRFLSLFLSLSAVTLNLESTAAFLHFRLVFGCIHVLFLSQGVIADCHDPFIDLTFIRDLLWRVWGRAFGGDL